MTHRGNGSALGLALLGVVAWATAGVGHCIEPQGEPLSMEASELAAMAGEVEPDGSPLEILWESIDTSIDDEGRAVRGHHRIVRIGTAQGLEEGSLLAATFAPWHQEPPQLEARTVTPQGEVLTLDRDTVTEAAESRESQRRVLRAPIPGTSPGAIVETWVVVRDSAPPSLLGAEGTVDVDPRARHGRVVIEAPTAAGLQVDATLPEAAGPKREDVEGRLRFTLTREPLPEGETASVRYTTVPSWPDAAARLATLFEPLSAPEITSAAAPAKGLAGVDAALALQPVLADIQARPSALNAGPIDPTSPSEVLEKGYADSAALARLLVSLLRASGVEAHVALVRRGLESEEGLPGATWFDHALVHVSPDVWVDPSSPTLAPGQLPPECQGRSALILEPGSELVLTPQEEAADTRLTISREVQLVEQGAVEVKTTCEATGAFADGLRRDYGGVIESKLEEYFERHVESFAGAEKLVGYDVTGLSDPGGTVKLSFEGEGSTEYATEGTRADGVVFIDSLFAGLPDALLQAEAAQATRLPFAHVVELSVKVVPPIGFESTNVPTDRDETIGPAALRVTWSRDGDGAISMTSSFDSGGRDYDDEAAAAVSERVNALLEAAAPTVRFRLKADRLLGEGKWSEALKGFQSLCDEHPTEALHRIQLADALLQVGLGADAVAEARKAVELQPDLADAHLWLGRALASDELGRPYGLGFDFEGAEAAYRQALTLDPEMDEARWYLGELLEHDVKGTPFSGDRLADAVTVYRENEGFEENLARCLFFQEKFEELQKFTASTDVPGGVGFDAAALVATQGVSAGVALIRTTIPDLEGQRQALAEASTYLWMLRRYTDAARMLRESAPGAPDEADRRSFANLLGGMKRHEELKLPLHDPTNVVRRFLIQLAAAEADPEAIAGLISEAVPADARDEAIEEMRRESSWLYAYDDRIRRLLIDAILSVTRMEKDGNPAIGMRVRLTISSGNVSQNDIYYVCREGNGYRIAGMETNLEWLGLQALARLRMGDINGARLWLDWARTNGRMVGAGDRLSGPAFTRIWQPGLLAGAEEVKLAAAALLIGVTPAHSLQVLTPARDAAAGADRVDLDMGVMEALDALSREPEALEIATRMGEKFPLSVMGFLRRADLLIRQDQLDEAHRLAIARLHGNPKDVASTVILAFVASAKGDVKEVRKRLNELQKISSMGERQLAWTALFTGRVTQDDLDRAHRAARETPHGSFASQARALRTLAAVQAEHGHLEAARDTLLEGVQLLGGQPEPDDWYVLGRIAEKLGRRDAARAAYQRVEKPEPDADVEMMGSAWTLAQRHLERL